MTNRPPPDNSQQSAAKKRNSTPKRLRLERLTIHNLKAIDKLDISLPAPDIKTDPDIFVMGSKNGLGKTSFLEACFTIFLATMRRRSTFSFRLDADLRSYIEPLFDLPDLIIRAGAKQAEIEGSFSLGSQTTAQIKVTLDRSALVTVEGDRSVFEKLFTAARPLPTDPLESISRFLYLLAGLNSDPLIAPPYFYFHSYRKVQEGNLELGQIVERPHRLRRSSEPPISIFKRDVLRLLMGRGRLFEDLNYTESDATLKQLNVLMQQYAGGRIEKLRTSERGTVEFPITPDNGGPSFNFDGLSSGQKEIISTLFLIWRCTRNQPGIVLIDEPELHLNPEWHRSFIRSLYTLAPENQYLIATHSEDVFAAVERERRLILTANVEWETSFSCNCQQMFPGENENKDFARERGYQGDCSRSTQTTSQPTTTRFSATLHAYIQTDTAMKWKGEPGI